MNENTIKAEPVVLPVLPLKNLVALPKSIIPVVVGRDVSIQAVNEAMRRDKQVFVTAQRNVDVQNPGADDIYNHGTRAIILQLARMPNGTLKILIEGIVRSRIVEVVQTAEYMSVVAQDLPSDPLKKTPENNALWRNLFDLFKKYVGMSEKISSEVLTLFHGVEDIDYLTDTIAVQMNLDLLQRQHVLELVDLKERALNLCVLLEKEIEILEAEKSIRQRVQSQVEKHQRDYYLTEQMRAIQRELGRDDFSQEIEELRKKAKGIKLSSEASEKVEAELKRLEGMQPTSPEATVSKNYIDWILSLPWHEKTSDAISMEEAESMLNASHAGLKKAKDRIIEFLASKKFAGKNMSRSPILCLVGPPGVGKTSLAQSIALALGRKMARISLGGIRDEAEIRGHRRTYIGAMPGKIIQAMKKAKVTNPVIVLDEIDKMAMDFRGDPASALLEVLDPEQNKNFSDHFLEIDYDLSKVMFITTANVADNIPYPLLDRMELVFLSGYTEAEKLEIALKFLLPKLRKEHALSEKNIIIDQELIKKMIEEYTKEAGVRQLERVLAKVLRKGILLLLQQKTKRKKSIVVTEKVLEEWLGAPIFRRDDRKREDSIGVATGLAWTEVGGDILDIEVTVMKGKGGLTLTGQLGEVMQESAQAAMSFLRSHAKDFGLKQDFYSECDVHVHIPEGAIPKDGPSAGITITTALTSAFTHIPVCRDVAMTGEVTLRGRVLQIGGLKEKLLAAIRCGITKVIVPKSNAQDVKEFEHELDKKLSIVYAESMDQVLKEALLKDPFSPENHEKKHKQKLVHRKLEREKERLGVGGKKEKKAHKK